MNPEVWHRIQELPWPLLVLLGLLGLGVVGALVERFSGDPVGRRRAWARVGFWALVVLCILLNGMALLSRGYELLGVQLASGLSLSLAPTRTVPLFLSWMGIGLVGALLVSVGMVIVRSLELRRRSTLEKPVPAWLGFLGLALSFCPHSLVWWAGSLVLLRHRHRLDTVQGRKRRASWRAWPWVIPLALMVQSLILLRLLGVDLPVQRNAMPWALLGQAKGLLFTTSLEDLGVLFLLSWVAMGVGIVSLLRTRPLGSLLGLGVLLADMARGLPLVRETFSFQTFMIAVLTVAGAEALIWGWCRGREAFSRWRKDRKNEEERANAGDEGKELPLAQPKACFFLRHRETLLLLGAVLALGLWMGVGSWLNY